MDVKVPLLSALLATAASGAQVVARTNATLQVPGSLHAPFAGVYPPASTPRRPRRSFLQVDDSPSSAGRVLYYVYSDSRFYDTRLRWVLDTWAQKVPQGDLTVIGDAPFAGNTSNARIVSTDCPKHSHWEGACCKYAQAVRQAHAQMEEDHSVQWAYFVDDDAYVRPEVLEQALAKETDLEDRGVALGNLGCTTPLCSFSICAGGGYAANRRAIYKAIGDSDTTLQASEMVNCARCDRWADAAMTQVFLEKKIELRPLQGLNGWKLTKTKFDHSVQAEFEPIMYHYIQTQSQMQFLHHMFAGAEAGYASSDPSAVDTEQCTTYHGERECALSDDPKDTPWVPDDEGKAVALIQLCEAED